LPDELFDAATASYDFRTLCDVTLRHGASTGVREVCVEVIGAH
jgi:hypothetical protein